MAELRAHGISVVPPGGWDARISVRRDGLPQTAFTASATRLPLLQSRPVVHLANFGLPEARGDFGSGAVELMGDRDVFIVLFEHEPAASGTALFREVGLPRVVTNGDFDPATLRRSIAGQSAHQAFFHEPGRAFCLYVVLGSHPRRARLIPMVNRVLATVRLDAKPLK